jgi:hypothetical protein
MSVIDEVREHVIDEAYSLGVVTYANKALLGKIFDAALEQYEVVEGYGQLTPSLAEFVQGDMIEADEVEEYHLNNALLLVRKAE